MGATIHAGRNCPDCGSDGTPRGDGFHRTFVCSECGNAWSNAR